MSKDYLFEGNSSRSFQARRWKTALFLAVAAVAVVALVLGSVAVSRKDNFEMKNGFAAVRLFPGDDLLSGVMKPVLEKGLRSAWIVSCSGSLTQYAIRFANQSNTNVSSPAHFEIVSLSGTLSSNSNDGRDGSWHLHIAVADSKGTTIAGHLASNYNSTVYTTVELVIGFSCDFEFERGHDGSTPWDELQIIHRSWC